MGMYRRFKKVCSCPKLNLQCDFTYVQASGAHEYSECVISNVNIFWKSYTMVIRWNRIIQSPPYPSHAIVEFWEMAHLFELNELLLDTSFCIVFPYYFVLAGAGSCNPSAPLPLRLYYYYLLNVIRFSRKKCVSNILIVYYQQFLQHVFSFHSEVYLRTTQTKRLQVRS